MSKIYLMVVEQFPVGPLHVMRINTQDTSTRFSDAWGHLLARRKKCPFSSELSNSVFHFTSSFFKPYISLIFNLTKLTKTSHLCFPVSPTLIPLDQGPPAPRPWTGTCLWPVRNQAAQQEVSGGRASKRSFICIYSRSPSLTLLPELHLLSALQWLV